MDHFDSEKSGIADETLIVSGGQGDCDPQDFISPGEGRVLLMNSELRCVLFPPGLAPTFVSCMGP